MRRRSDFETARENRGALLLSAFFVAFGMALPYFSASGEALKDNVDPSLLLLSLPSFVLSAGNFTAFSTFVPLPQNAPTSVYIISIFFILIGLLSLSLFRWSVTRNRKLREARDKRIAKKYGFPFPDTIDGARVIEYTKVEGHPEAKYMAICRYEGERSYNLFHLDGSFETIADWLFDDIKTCRRTRFKGVHWLKKLH